MELVTYFRGSSSYPHPACAGKHLLYIRNRPGLRVCVDEADAPKLRYFDLFMDRTGSIQYKNVAGRQKLLRDLIPNYTLFRHELDVTSGTDCPLLILRPE